MLYQCLFFFFFLIYKCYKYVICRIDFRNQLSRRLYLYIICTYKHNIYIRYTMLLLYIMSFARQRKGSCLVPPKMREKSSAVQVAVQYVHCASQYTYSTLLHRHGGGSAATRYSALDLQSGRGGAVVAYHVQCTLVYCTYRAVYLRVAAATASSKVALAPRIVRQDIIVL